MGLMASTQLHIGGVRQNELLYRWKRKAPAVCHHLPIYMHGTSAFSFTDGVKKHETEKMELMTKQAILDGNITKQSAEAHGTIK